MFESIRGVLTEKTPQKAVVEAGGIGYRLAIPLSAYAQLPDLQKPIFFYLTQVVREDSNTLYAFLTKEERDLFETLITLSGIGPKTALAIIGHLEMALFQQAIFSADTRLLSKIPGVGKKTAERLVIEMRDKFKKVKALPAPALHSDALNALLHLGYPLPQAEKALHAALSEHKGETDLGKIITAALQNI